MFRATSYRVSVRFYSRTQSACARIAFISRFYSPGACTSLLQRGTISLYRSNYSRVDPPSAKLITFRGYRPVSRESAFVSIALSTYRNPDYPVYCCFAVLSFFLPPSLPPCLPLFYFFSLLLCTHPSLCSACLRKVRGTRCN